MFKTEVSQLYPYEKDKMLANTAQEEVKLAAMQRIWQTRRMPGASTSSLLFEDASQLFQDPFEPLSQNGMVTKGRGCSSPPLSTKPCNDGESEILQTSQDLLYESKPELEPLEEEEEISWQVLDASTVDDLPACYTIFGLKPHQMPVVGVYIDRRVCPGFKYKVLPLSGPELLPKSSPGYLFEGKALTLRSIGRGYARRFTFEADKDHLNDNENYFWSDNRPEGFAFELELVSDGDKFTIFDANHEAQGTLEIIKIEGPQVELNTETTKDGVKKRAKIHFAGKVEFYETGVAKPMPLAGVVVSLKRRGAPTAQVVKIINVTIRHHRYYLSPGVQKTHRRVTVRGEDIGDVPTKYTMTGLEPYEIPIVGTYVDPRVVAGFHYKVRPNDRKEHLFEGRALKLCSIGMGYAKRLTFAPDSLVDPNNFLWSDNHPDGLGLEPRAVHTGMRFRIMAGDQGLGEACVFRADLPQVEEKMEKITMSSGKCAVVKYIHVDVMCHVKLAIIGGRSNDSEQHLMRVYGLAVVRKEPGSSTARIQRVENVGLDSQLNVLFARTHTELTFYPL